MRFISSALSLIRYIKSSLSKIDAGLDEVRINQGRILSRLNTSETSKRIQEFEFKVFSQWGEDGIIQRLVDVVEIRDKTFIEFGVEDFSESNCRFLMMKDNWSGFVIDGSASNIQTLKQWNSYWKYDLNALSEFITRENINDLLAKSGFGEDLGILSVDIDGNDYHVLEAIRFFKPRIIICEYNALFGPERIVTIPYDASFVRGKKHYSNLYYGASLGALTQLCNSRGYSLVGTNSAGSNAFFVRGDLMNDKLETLHACEAFTCVKLRESRDRAGRLNYLSEKDRLKAIQGVVLFNTETNQTEIL